MSVTETVPADTEVRVGAEFDSFEDVPSADPDAALDPHWSDMRGGSNLPAVYMPPSMPGHHSRWLRLMALGLTVMFFAATAAGVCLTYGPQPFGR
jgi:hypothetical protein